MVKILLCVLVSLGNAICGQCQRETGKIILGSGWEFRQAGSEQWLVAVVPGTVQQDLIRHGLLPDPFYGMNEDKVQWVEREDWEYRTNFHISEEQLRRDGVRLVFGGLDTYADVYLNGALVVKGDNMFVGYEADIKGLLKEGDNRLYIYFHSPIKQTLPQWASNGFDYPADNDHYEKRLSVFSRKAPYSYGWDWGIRMVTSGIWRPVELCFYDVVSIDDLYIRQLLLSDEVAKLSAELVLNAAQAIDTDVVVDIVWSLRGKTKGKKECQVAILSGENKINIPLQIDRPECWMPNGWGEPILYDIEVQVRCGDKLVAGRQQRVGLRTVRVVNEKDGAGESYYFEVNGIPIFAKGANYIPGDAMLPAMTDERYRTLFRDIREANMNMVRVWGGGVYEDDCFYDLADENGILVWQDFMFACTSYPHDPAFLRRVEAEADYNIRRLRNHACLAMWCGNNEILEGLKYWGWQRRYDPDVYEGMCKGYDKLFRELLPEKVKELDQGRFYIHGSPYFANWGRPDSWGTGDSHNWGVWYGEKPFESLDAEIPRFMSEFGFQSFPEMKTIASFAAPEDYRIGSEVMKSHQKSSIGNELIKKYMERDYVVPEKFEDFVYVGLVMQGQGMRRGFEAHRRNRPYCMGSLYWQLNDSWPVVSWSGIDYYGNWKALHYQAKRAFAPVAISVIEKRDSLNVYLLSDRLEQLEQLTIDMCLTDFSGKVVKSKSMPARISANSSLLALRELTDLWVTPGQRRNCFWLLILKDKAGRKLAEKVYFFDAPKNLNLPLAVVTYQVEQRAGEYEVTLTSDKLAKDVFIEIPVQGARFSDNFFDLLPGKKQKVIITSPLLGKDQKVKLSVRHLAETCQ